MCKDLEEEILKKVRLKDTADYPSELQAAYEKAVRTGGLADLNDFLAKRRIWREEIPTKLAQNVEMKPCGAFRGG